jgi:hypothetical protein
MLGYAIANPLLTNTSWLLHGIEIHQEDLLADWDLAVHGNKPFPITGLDQ